MNNWKSNVNQIKDFFLDPRDVNIKKIHKYLDTIDESIIKGSSERPYLGELDDLYEFLNNYSQLSESSRDPIHVLKIASSIFSGSLKWHHPNIMHNIIPPTLLSSIAASTVSSLYNLNSIWDFISAGSQKMEKQVTNQLANLAGWNENAAGTFTFGGKGCIMYAMRIALGRFIKNISTNGMAHCKKKPVVLTSAENHYCIDTAASLLGLGSKNVWRTSVHPNETMNLKSLDDLIVKAYEAKRDVIMLIVCGGSALHLTIDNLKGATEIIDKRCLEYRKKRPYIYFDTCVGWPWLFFSEYNFSENPLLIAPDVMEILQDGYNKISDIKLADGFGVDFHKLGFCSYSTSIFMNKDKAELESINKDTNEELPANPRGNNFVHQYTIEHSKSAAPIMSAWVTLQTLGKDGFRSYLTNQISYSHALREKLTGPGMELLNTYSLSQGSVYFPTSEKNRINYSQLNDLDRDKIKKYNKYTFELFKYFSNDRENGIASYVFRYIPQFRRANCGENMAVLAILPMSPHCSLDNIDKTVQQIQFIKKDFDQRFVKKDFFYDMPEHVLK